MGFAPKSRQRLRIAGHIFGQKLERDEAAKPGVLGLVNHPHSATPEFLQHAVMGDHLAEHGPEILGLRMGLVNERGHFELPSLDATLGER